MARHFLNDCNCADKMLTDCGCVAHVYADGSGVDLTYCALHAGAAQLLECCRTLTTTWSFRRSYTDAEFVALLAELLPHIEMAVDAALEP